MDTAAIEVPTIPGTPFGGGFYAGRILVDGEAHALIVSPQAEGDHEDAPWGRGIVPSSAIAGFYDGLVNTGDMAEAGSAIAKWARDLRIAGLDDWYIPSRDELEILYRAFKPTTEENYCYRGDNPSSVPVGYAYSRTSPAQTTVEAFREGASEAFETGWYWSSTQYAGYEAYAWCQYFGYGDQDGTHKDYECRVRAVRRLKI